jgi:predicted GNAT family acetyltransferase
MLRDNDPMPDSRRALQVTRRDDRGRYELHDGDEVVSFAEFSEADGVVTVPYVETHVHHRGNGHSSRLMAGVVEDLRTRGVRIDPVCPVARWYVQALPDADRLLAAGPGAEHDELMED